MKNNRLQTKRKTQKGFRAMYARTVGKKVKASAAASADELEGDVPSVGIGKALTVILILHVLAIVAIYVGTQWKGDDSNGKSNAIALDLDNKSADETGQTTNTNTGTIYLDAPSSYDLDNDTQAEAAATNEILNDPAAEQRLAVEPPRRRPKVIKPRRNPNKIRAMSNPTPAYTEYSTYKIQKGDNFYRLAKKYNVKQQELIDMNPDVDARKMKPGMSINVPRN